MTASNTFNINVPVNLNRQELRNAILQVLASAPGSPILGLMYSDSTLDSPYWYSSTRSAWIPLDATKASGIPNTALATNPLARANHTGTQLASTISNLATTVQGYTLDLFAAPAAAVSFNSQKITNLATPTVSTDAANKGYVDTAVQSASAGVSGKGSCVALSTSNIATLSGTSTTVDGIALNAAGMRVLLTGQTTASQNGPWVIASGSWTRPTTDANNELETGALWFIEQGTINAASQWWLNSPAAGTTITPGTTAIGIVKFAAAPVYTAATNGGLTLTSGAFAVAPNTGITVGAGGVGVDTTKVPFKYATTIGNNSATSFTVTHNLGTTDVVVSLVNLTTNDIEYTAVNVATTNTVTVVFAVAPTTNQYRVIVHG